MQLSPLATTSGSIRLEAGPRSGLKVGGLNGERSELRWGSGGLPPENFPRPRPLERRKTPLSKKDVLIYVHIKLQFF